MQLATLLALSLALGAGVVTFLRDRAIVANAGSDAFHDLYFKHRVTMMRVNLLIALLAVGIRPPLLR